MGETGGDTMRNLNMTKLVWSFALAALLMTAAGRAADGDGGYAGSFLQVPIGARPTAMGGAYIAVSNDGAGPLYNPAGLANITRPIFATSYRFLQLDRKLGYATLLFPVKNQAMLGVHWLYAGSGSVAMRDADGLLTGDLFSFNSHVFSIVFAKRFENYLAVGTKLNYIYERMPQVSAQSVGFDFGGMLYVNEFIDRERRDQLFVQDLQVGLTVKNIANKLNWNSEQFNQAYANLGSLGFEQVDQIPIEVGLGISGRMIKRKLLTDIDIVKNTKQHVMFHGGAEFFVTPEFALRSGYSEHRFTAGTGYVFKLKKSVLAIDYAFSTDRAGEGSEHIFSFDFLY